MEIIRGTTPTLIFKFSQINAEDIDVAYLLIRQGDETVIEKTRADGLITENSISFTLTQEDTLQLTTNYKARIVLDWKTTEGLRGRSNIYESAVGPAGVNSII